LEELLQLIEEHHPDARERNLKENVLTDPLAQAEFDKARVTLGKDSLRS
jgi:hypothetical protein